MTTFNRLFRCGIGFVLGCTLLVCGCGRDVPSGDVEGVVTLDGKPLDDVVVTFLPDPAQNTIGATATATTDSQGKYKLTPATGSTSGVVVGHHRVTLRDMKNYQPPAGRGGGRGAAEAPASPAIRRVPATYEDAGTTPLNREVKPGSQTINFELSREPNKK